MGPPTSTTCTDRVLPHTFTIIILAVKDVTAHLVLLKRPGAYPAKSQSKRGDKAKNVLTP